LWKSLDPDLDAEAIKALSKWLFQPAHGTVQFARYTTRNPEIGFKAQ
jgi:hypothetical protein